MLGGESDDSFLAACVIRQRVAVGSKRERGPEELGPRSDVPGLRKRRRKGGLLLRYDCDVNRV